MMQAPASGISLSAAALAFLAISVDASAKLQIGLRFVHILAGILWVGLLYFFTLVNLRFLSELDAATRLRIYARLMRPALWWFRWASVVTVLAGIWYWMIIDWRRQGERPRRRHRPAPRTGNRQLFRHLDHGFFRNDRDFHDGQAQPPRSAARHYFCRARRRPPPGFTFP